MYVDQTPGEKQELRQGDVFDCLPWLLFDPGQVGSKEGIIDLAATGLPANQQLVMRAELAPGVILSADCDCAQASLLTVCRLRPITAKEPKFYQKSLKDQLLCKRDFQRRRIGVFYLRPISSLPDAFVEFSELQTLPRDFLLKSRHNRLTTLTEEARQHLREKIAAYLTRFGPDERYIFTEEEMSAVSEYNIL